MILAARAVPLFQHTTGAQPSEHSWKDSQSGTVTASSWRDAPAHLGSQGAWVGGSDPWPRSQPRTRGGHSHLSFPSVGTAWHVPGSVPASAFADLVLETWDLHCDRNGREHRTAAMGCEQLVVRRGQPFAITLRFSGRAYEEALDKLSFNVETGECRHICVASEGCHHPLPQSSPVLPRGLCHGTCPMSHSPCSSPGRGWCCAQLLYHKKKR